MSTVSHRALPDAMEAPRRSARSRPGPWARLCSYSFTVPYCVPQWDAGTYAALLGPLLTGRLLAGPAIAALESRLGALLGVPRVMAFGSGRAALEAGLRAASVGPGCEVILPAFCCRSVLTPVEAVGATPVFADAGPELNVTADTVAARMTDRTRAVVIAHLFGNPAEIERIVSLCRDRGVAAVDDAAQALGARAAGRALGSLGDWGIVSFGNGKICFGTGGGALLTHDAGLADRAARLERTRPRAGDAAGRVWSTVLWRRWRRWTLPLRVAVRRGRPGNPAVTPQRIDAPRNVDASVALSLLRHLPEQVRARRERVEAYHAGLAGAPGVHLVPHREGSACLSQVVRVDAGPEAAVRLRGALLAAGYEVTRSYTPLHLAASHPSTPPGTLPAIEAVWASLVELPCEPSVPLFHAARICDIIRRETGGTG